MDISAHIETSLRARCPLLVLVTHEEPRTVRIIRNICEQRSRPCYSWELGDGFSRITQTNTPIMSGNDPLAALKQIESGPDNGVFILLDFHRCLKEARILRKFRSEVQRIIYTRKSIILLTPATELPDELNDLALVEHVPLPDISELNTVLQHLLKTPGVQHDLDEERTHKLLRAASGLTEMQAQRVFAKAIVQDGTLSEDDTTLIALEKKQILGKSQALEFYSHTETPSNVGGLCALKEWLRLRERAYSSEAQTYGLPTPKGIALIGIPGTGKSLSAKMIAHLWGLPLLRLDVGALFGSFIGQSEERVRQALRLAERVAPCVLWIDEMEKALAQGSSDGGTSTRVFGSILTWMSDKEAPVFVTATANDVSKLPPELLRRGRFDEIFFLDLPNEIERRAILEVHLRKRGREPQNFDLDSLVQASQGFVGAELEQGIIDAMYQGFADDREFTTEDIHTALNRLVPLSVAQQEKINYLRLWLTEGRARSASAA